MLRKKFFYEKRYKDAILATNDLEMHELSINDKRCIYLIKYLSHAKLKNHDELKTFFKNLKEK